MGREPRPLLLRVLAERDEVGHAIDLGCGPGNDTLELLREGWTVHAIDAHAIAVETTRGRAAAADVDDRLTTSIARFAAIDLEPASADVIHAGFSLPFTTRDEFDAIWSAIGKALRPAGIFIGQLFGVNDTWARDPDRRELTAFTREEVHGLLNDYSVEHLEEVDRDGTTSTGTEKHWHVFHIIARRIGNRT